MSHPQFYYLNWFILRLAWLNLWDKHMTTGRINQVIISSYSYLKHNPHRLTIHMFLFCSITHLTYLQKKNQKWNEWVMTKNPILPNNLINKSSLSSSSSLWQQQQQQQLVSISWVEDIFYVLYCFFLYCI